MAQNLVTPVMGSASVVSAAGQAVVAVPPAPNGGFITNPASPVDQGITTAEVLYVDPAGTCAPIGGTLYAYGTVFALYPGQTWTLVPGQTTSTYVNAATAGHKFSVVAW